MRAEYTNGHAYIRTAKDNAIQGIGKGAAYVTCGSLGQSGMALKQGSPAAAATVSNANQQTRDRK